MGAQMGKMTRISAIAWLALLPAFRIANGQLEKAANSNEPCTPFEIVQFNNDQLAKLYKEIAGKEDQPAEAVFKNIKSLTGMPAGTLLRVMQIGYSRSLGTSCAHCHIPGQWEKDDKKPKQIARDMSKMTNAINFDYLRNIEAIKDRNPILNCTTCHRGQLKPALNMDSDAAKR
jgi:hypothetical protein